MNITNIIPHNGSIQPKTPAIPLDVASPLFFLQVLAAYQTLSAAQQVAFNEELKQKIAQFHANANVGGM